MSKNTALGVAAVAMVLVASYALFGPEPGPIIACDPTKLAKGAAIDEVRQLCGRPRSSRIDRKVGDGCYPLSGDTCPAPAPFDETLYYGDVGGAPNVNLYFTAGKLRSVQIYGDWR